MYYYCLSPVGSTAYPKALRRLLGDAAGAKGRRRQIRKLSPRHLGTSDQAGTVSSLNPYLRTRLISAAIVFTQ